MQITDKILVSDFDGTMTEHDFFRVALAHLLPDAAAPWERYEQGFYTVLSSRDCLDEVRSMLESDPALSGCFTH